MPQNPKPSLSDPVQFLKGVGPKRAELLHRLGLQTAEDCVQFLPFRYEDRRHICKIAELHRGETATFSGVVTDAGLLRMGRRRRLFEVVVEDGTGQVRAKWFKFREQYMGEKYTAGQSLLLTGKLVENRYLGAGLEVVHPDVEFLENEAELKNVSGKIIPVYSSTEGLNQKSLRQIMQNVVEHYLPLVEEFIPPNVMASQKLIPRRDALEQAHCPPAGQRLTELGKCRSPGQTRLIFEEFFLLQMGLSLKRRHEKTREKGLALKTRGPLIQKLMRQLPFELTGAQKKVLTRIMQDLEQDRPMNRLLHGDVGSGKTLVALITLLTAIDNGLQGALMAPTELLAEQHYLNLKPYCEALNVGLDLSISALPPADKEAIRQRVESGETQLVVGTHSLIQKDVRFAKLGLAVIDEQHRFGVLQREALGKKGTSPHVLVMTATPIPRSLAMTLYGDMDVCQLDELPPGRRPIATKKFYENRRDEAYRIIDREIQKGRQAYVVCPLIEESEKVDLHTVTDVHEDLKRRYPGWNTALLHGRLKKEERQRIMMQFKDGAIQVLVATTVIEVGIDVPNATLMLIEHAERFGLAQLHQLRGRVGRGQYDSLCLLVAHHPISPEAKARLDAMVKSQDGFYIAEQDLNIRGPGDLMGTRQSGLPLLRVANLVRDAEYIEPARKEALKIVEADPGLVLPENQPLKLALENALGGRLQLASIL